MMLNETMKRVLFFSCEPGGAEVLIPLIRLVQAHPNLEAVVLGYGHALARFAKKGIACTEVKPVLKDDFSLLDSYVPDLIITSATSLPNMDMSEKYLWRQAKRRGIPSLAFLDQWQNYAVRFSGPDAGERLAFLPDYINCIDGIGEREMIEEGFDSQVLVKLGQPYLTSLVGDAKLIKTHVIKERLEIQLDQRVVLFASEAIREHYGRVRGYDQYDALRLFLELMSNRVQETTQFLIKLHPKDTLEGYVRILSEYPNIRSKVLKDELSPMECIQVSDEVYGMTSIMLIEAYILGKKTVSLQPGLVGADPCVLSRHCLIPVITSNNVIDPAPLALPQKNDFVFEFQSNQFLMLLESLISRRRGLG